MSRQAAGGEGAGQPARRPVLLSRTVMLGYADTDPAGILYYAAWFPKMENLQSEFLFRQGMRQDTLKETQGWWTVTRATECEYLVAARLYDEIRIELRIGEIRTSSFSFAFEMRRTSDEVLVARASLTLVAVSPDQSAVRMPDSLREQLEAWATTGGR